MFRRLLSVGGFTLLSRITGFVRDILMAWVLGKGILSDAFIVAFLFPSYFRSIFGEGTINPAFLPRYAALHARGEHDAAALFADRVFSWQMLAQLVILVAALVFMPFLVRLIAPGFADNPGQLALTVSLSRITFPYLILTVVAIQLSAMLNAINKFWAAAAWSNFQNLGMIATLLAAPWFPNAAYAAAWGLLLGGFLQLFFMLWASARDGLSLHVARPRWTPEIKEFFKALGAVTVGAASVFIAPFIDRSSQACCRSEAGPRSTMPTASTSCRWACSASRSAPCSCPRCRRGWRSTTAPGPTGRRTIPRRCRCC
jgi:putative peptidoglycan lipid II flippase